MVLTFAQIQLFVSSLEGVALAWVKRAGKPTISKVGTVNDVVRSWCCSKMIAGCQNEFRNSYSVFVFVLVFYFFMFLNLKKLH